jgi:hypothetical protein
MNERNPTIIGFALEHAQQSIEHATDGIRELFPKTGDSVGVAGQAGEAC